MLRWRDDKDTGEYWELLGGSLDPGETPEQACAREIAEETGYVVPLAAVGPAGWRRRATFFRGGKRRWKDEAIHIVRLPGTPESGSDQQAAFGVRWWSAAELAAHTGRFYPGRLAELGPQVLGGVDVDEGFERWS